MAEWLETAGAEIARIDAASPAGATVEQRLAAIDAGYPFGARRCFAYKAWLKARREWRGRNGAPIPRRLETPLERAIRGTREAEAARTPQLQQA
jgi:Ser/Thr protein kinase RdoA (MazF antagonist)